MNSTESCSKHWLQVHTFKFEYNFRNVLGGNLIMLFLVQFCLSASKQRVRVDTNPYNDELKLAVAWNRVDIAKSELFNGHIHWKVRRKSHEMLHS